MISGSIFGLIIAGLTIIYLISLVAIHGYFNRRLKVLKNTFDQEILDSVNQILYSVSGYTHPLTVKTDPPAVQVPAPQPPPPPEKRTRKISID